MQLHQGIFFICYRFYLGSEEAGASSRVFGPRVSGGSSLSDRKNDGGDSVPLRICSRDVQPLGGA